MKEVSFNKRMLFVLFAFIGSLISVDIGFQIIYAIAYGEFTWNTINDIEQFHVGPDVCLVSDERNVILKKKYQGSIITGNYRGTINTDENGFRCGSHKLSRTEGNIVFIGDSVPFGFRLDDYDTVPSSLNDILKKKGKTASIINAAMPSYSLNQAIYRYKYEISGKFPVDIVILQVIDPAMLFAQYGREWDASKNWATWPENLRRKIGEKGILSVDSFLQYSSLFYLYWRFSGRYHLLNVKFNINDQEAINKYVGSINNSLDILFKECGGSEMIIILPATVTKYSNKTMCSPTKKAIEILNQTMLDYSKKRTEIYFLDTIELFSKYKDRDVFIDSGCHLSPKGARLQAQLIADFIAGVE